MAVISSTPPQIAPRAPSALAEARAAFFQKAPAVADNSAPPAAPQAPRKPESGVVSRDASAAPSDRTMRPGSLLDIRV
jgi:hypothetical protein